MRWARILRFNTSSSETLKPSFNTLAITPIHTSDKTLWPSCPYTLVTKHFDHHAHTHWWQNTLAIMPIHTGENTLWPSRPYTLVWRTLWPSCPYTLVKEHFDHHAHTYWWQNTLTIMPIHTGERTLWPSRPYTLVWRTFWPSCPYTLVTKHFDHNAHTHWWQNNLTIMPIHTGDRTRWPSRL